MIPMNTMNASISTKTATPASVSAETKAVFAMIDEANARVEQKETHAKAIKKAAKANKKLKKASKKLAKAEAKVAAKAAKAEGGFAAPAKSFEVQTLAAASRNSGVMPTDPSLLNELRLHLTEQGGVTEVQATTSVSIEEGGVGAVIEHTTANTDSPLGNALRNAARNGGRGRSSE